MVGLRLKGKANPLTKKPRIVSQILAIHNRKDVAEDINKLGGHEFEDLIERLLLKMGFKTEGRKKAADGGIDIVALSSQPLVSGRYIIQCKRYGNSVSSPIVRDLYGVVNATNANKGILITTSTFTSEAVEFARDKPIELIDGSQLLELLNEYSLLVAEVAQGTNAKALMLARLRNEFIGSAESYSSKLKEAESGLGLLSRRSLGRESDRKTYALYDEFRLDVFKELNEASKAGKDIIAALSETSRSEIEVEQIAQIRRNTDEYAQFLVDLFKRVREIVPPSEFAQAHAIMLDIVHTYVNNFLTFTRQFEDRLEKEKPTHVEPQDQIPISYDMRLIRMEEWKTAWAEGRKRVNSRLGGLFSVS